MSDELRAALETCVLADRGACGRLLGTGPDLLDLLNRLSTKAVKGLTEGQGCATVLTTNKGRIVERLFVNHLGDDGVLLVAGPGGAERALTHIARYTFAEDTGLADVGDSWFHLALVGPEAAGVLEGWKVEGVHVLGHDGVSMEGLSIVGPREHEPQVRERLKDVPVAGDETLEAWRVLRGHPADGHELTEEANPLEAGLWNAVDFDKGCYVGQEVVARLDTYDKVSRSLVGLRTDDEVPQRGTFLLSGDRRVGVVTSALPVPEYGGVFGLAYVKKDHSSSGGQLVLDQPGDGQATLHALPFDLS